MTDTGTDMGRAGVALATSVLAVLLTVGLIAPTARAASGVVETAKQATTEIPEENLLDVAVVVQARDTTR